MSCVCRERSSESHSLGLDVEPHPPASHTHVCTQTHEALLPRAVTCFEPEPPRVAEWDPKSSPKSQACWEPDRI